MRLESGDPREVLRVNNYNRKLTEQRYNKHNQLVDMVKSRQEK